MTNIFLILFLTYLGIIRANLVNILDSINNNSLPTSSGKNLPIF